MRNKQQSAFCEHLSITVNEKEKQILSMNTPRSRNTIT